MDRHLSPDLHYNVKVKRDLVAKVLKMPLLLSQFSAEATIGREHAPTLAPEHLPHSGPLRPQTQ